MKKYHLLTATLLFFVVINVDYFIDLLDMQLNIHI